MTLRLLLISALFVAATGYRTYRVEAETIPVRPSLETLPMQIADWRGRNDPPFERDIIDKLAAALDQALNEPGVQTRLADLGGSLPTKDERTPAKLESFVKAEIARWSPILKAANVEAK